MTSLAYELWMRFPHFMPRPLIPIDVLSLPAIVYTRSHMLSSDDPCKRDCEECTSASTYADLEMEATGGHY